MRSRTFSLSVIGAMLVAGVALVPAGPADALECSSGSGFTGRGGGAEVLCYLLDRDGPPRHSLTDRERWDRYCAAIPLVPPWEKQEKEGWGPFEMRGPTQSDQPVDDHTLELLGLDPGGDYSLWSVGCTAPGVPGLPGYPLVMFIVWEKAAPVDPVALRDEAAARINPPAPSLGTSPPFDQWPAIVQMPTWLWITDPWVTDVEAESQGGVSVVVAARPDRVTWTFGDGGSVVCFGPGVAWQSGLSEDATDCSYTFTHTSAGLPDSRYDATATVTWVFSWTLNGVDQGDFGSFDATSSFSIEVGEIQVIEVNG
ncbi:MAG: hypothetical protein IH942_02930 [Acidobacteria bacterium]|nr:hypothetical protein [Acidobacteriota bacterium]